MFITRVLATLKSIVNVLNLDPKQERHSMGDGYIEGRSYYKTAPTIEQIRGWIMESLSTGKLTRKNGYWRGQAMIHHPSLEGVVWPHEKLSIKEPIKTFYSKVHFNKKGEIHIVPYYEGEYDQR